MVWSASRWWNPARRGRVLERGVSDGGGEGRADLSRNSLPASGTACLDICVHCFSDSVFFGEKLQTDDVTADGTALAPLHVDEHSTTNQTFRLSTHPPFKNHERFFVPTQF
ncbi:unnamed protein product [Linum trigynum]|uniref:Uncharacterized protein n=1 Tax=Linum trigynum TaxID=586398 RepID=A0AAV2FPB9_9ROSI